MVVKRATLRRSLGVAAAPFRFLGWGILSILGTLVVSALLGAVAFNLLGAALTQTLAEQGLAAGAWSIRAILTLLGAVAGALSGSAVAARRAMRRAEAEARDWLLHVPPEDERRLLPSIPLERLRSGYDRTLDAMISDSLAGFRLPNIVRRVIRSRLRRAFVNDFITACERRGTGVVGFAEVRDWLLAEGLRFAVGPIEARVRVWQYLVTGLVGVVFAGIAMLTLRVNPAEAGVLITRTLMGIGALVLIVGLPRASRHRFPNRWRLGVAVGGGGLILWPLIYGLLLPLDLGALWVLVVAVTLGSFKWSADQALVEADRPG